MVGAYLYYVIIPKERRTERKGDRMGERFTAQQIEAWGRDGGVLIGDFFTREEMHAIEEDLGHVFAGCGRGPGIGTARNEKTPGAIGGFFPGQLKNLRDFPFACSPALNLIVLHPALIAFAQAALDTPDVHLYQAQAWAKYTGEADYDQPFHCDYTNHTLTVPAEDVGRGAVNFMIYLSDVSPAHGPIHFVPLPMSDPVAPECEILPDAAAQKALLRHEVAAVGRAGAVFAYRIDVYHRGTNLTARGGHRYALMVSYKAAGNDAVGHQAWPSSFARPWRLIFENATPDQLACVGIPRPGDPFWTARTIARAQARWPGWDMSAYRAALPSSGSR